jgi:hypothetical protein
MQAGVPIEQTPTLAGNSTLSEDTVGILLSTMLVNEQKQEGSSGDSERGIT